MVFIKDLCQWRYQIHGYWKNDGIGFVTSDSREVLQIAELHGPACCDRVWAAFVNFSDA